MLYLLHITRRQQLILYLRTIIIKLTLTQFFYLKTSVYTKLKQMLYSHQITIKKTFIDAIFILKRHYIQKLKQTRCLIHIKVKLTLMQIFILKHHFIHKAEVMPPFLQAIINQRLTHYYLCIIPRVKQTNY